MGQNSGRARTLESVIGIIFLFHLVIVVVVLLVIQSHFNMVRYGVSQIAVGEQTSKTPNERTEAYQDFTPRGQSETYDTDNLYYKIDGKAPMYQDTGFIKLTTQRFVNDANSELGFEQYLFDMGNAHNAFSVYSRQKRIDVIDMPDFDARGFGYKTTNSIYVVHGQYYIEMMGFAESDELLNAMKGIALKLIAQLPVDDKDKLTEIDVFPPEIIPGSVQLQIIDAYGFDGLTDTWSAKYKVDDKDLTIFFSKCSNTDEAKKVAKSYYDFLINNGAKVVDNSASVLDFMGSTEIVFAAGSFVGGVHEADDRDSALKAADALSKRLNEISEKTGG